jgi:hypothetical protein
MCDVSNSTDTLLPAAVNMSESSSPSNSLKQVLEFRAEDAIAVFMRSFCISSVESEAIFHQTLKWLWLGRFHQQDQSSDKPRELSIFPAITVIDEMWHAFVLCTRTYHDFCNRFMGGYLHHEPFIGAGDEGFDRALLLQNIRYVTRTLGRETATLWYAGYPATYAPSRLHSLRRKP